MKEIDKQLVTKGAVKQELEDAIRVLSPEPGTLLTKGRLCDYLRIAIDRLPPVPARRARPDGEIERPTVVCLCGSTRFLNAYKKASLEETMEGKIVLSIGCDMRTDKFFVAMSGDREKKIKDQLDELHLRKIDLADEVLILNVNGYIGQSTHKEIEYAKKYKKRIRYWTDEELLAKEVE